MTVMTAAGEVATRPAPVVSVIVPIYDRAANIPGLIKTLQQQTMVDWEAIIVDDGSPVPMAGPLAPFLSDARIRLLRLDRNGGVSAARNRGVAAARGQFVAFLDSDDLWHPTKLARQLQAMHSGEPQSARFCVTLTTVVMPGGWTRIRPNFDPRPGQSFAEYLYVDGGFAQASSLLVPRALALATPFREELRQYEDHLLFIDLHAAGARYVVVHEPLTIYNNETRAGRLGVRDDIDRGNAFLAAAGDLLVPKVQTAFRVRALGGALFRQRPVRAALLAGQALLQGAIRPVQLAGIVGRHIMPAQVWDIVRRAA